MPAPRPSPRACDVVAPGRARARAGSAAGSSGEATGPRRVRPPLLARGGAARRVAGATVDEVCARGFRCSRGRGAVVGADPHAPPSHADALLQAAAAVDAAARAATACGHFTIPAAAVTALLARFPALSLDTLLLAALPAAQAAAQPPVSHFRVGAAALGRSGAVHLGCNLELPGAPLSAALHAEQCAVAVARAAGERGLQALATTAMPCGHCRQFLAELPAAMDLRCLCSSGAAPATAATLAQLLPRAFGPTELLGPAAAPLLLQARHNGLQLGEEGVRVAREARLHGDTGRHAAIYAALAAANGAHAPYSGCPAGLALLWPDGTVVSGGSAESAAFNPTLTPLHATWAATVAGGRDIKAAVAAVLVEAPGAVASQAATCAALLAVLAPGAALTVLPWESNLAPQWALTQGKE